MLIDGNDKRGIDVGLLTKPSLSIKLLVSHLDDRQDGNRIFSRDCPEFTVQVNLATRVLVLVNHFKSKGSGSLPESNAPRKAPSFADSNALTFLYPRLDGWKLAAKLSGRSCFHVNQFMSHSEFCQSLPRRIPIRPILLQIYPHRLDLRIVLHHMLSVFATITR